MGLFLAWICWISCGCRDVAGGLVTAWLILSVTDSFGKTENGNGPTRSREAHRFVREGREIEKDVYNIHSQ